MHSSSDTVLAFIQAINNHEIGAITRLMTPDHEFVDSLGVVEKGRDSMRKAWIAYLFMIPDYTIEITGVFPLGESVAVTGTASGTVAVRGELPESNHWAIPIAVRVEVHDGLVARWQVFSDNDPVRRILNRS
jgi:hypothetical protein